MTRPARYPFVVRTWTDWGPATETTVGFVTEEEARHFAGIRPEPIIDLGQIGVGIIATRRLTAHPAMPSMALRDDFPDPRP